MFVELHFRTVADSSLDLGYTSVQEPVKLKSMDEPGEPHVNLHKLAALSEHDVYEQVTESHKPAAFLPHFPSVYPPDEHLMCFDFIYWASTLVPHEWEARYSFSCLQYLHC